MAVNQGLNVQLSADATQFIATLQAALAQAQAAASGMANTAASMSALANAANTANAAAASLNNSLNSTTQAGNSAGSSAQNLASTLNFVQQGASRLSVSIQNFNNSLISTSPVMRGFINDARNGQLSFVGLNGAVSQAGNAITGVNRIIQSVNNSLVGLNRNALSNSAVMRGFANSARLGQISYVGLNGSLTNAGRAMNNVRRPAGNASSALIDLGRIAQDAPFGFIAIQNNIPVLIDSFTRLSAASGGTGAAFRALGATIAGPAGIGLAVSAATALITVAVQKYGSLGAALDAVAGNLTKAQELQRKFNSAVAEGLGQTGGEIAKINGLISVARDENISREQRLRAIKLLQKEYPGYLDNINLENINSSKVADSIDKITQALIRQAKIRGAQELISKEQQKIFEAQLKPLQDQASSFQQIANAAKGIVIGGIGPVGSAKSLFLNIQSGANNSAKAVKDANDNISSLQKMINDLLKTDAKTRTNQFGPETETTTKHIKTVTDVLSTLQNELLKTNALFVNSGDTLQKLTSDQISNYENALKSLIDIKVLPGDPIFDALKSRVDDLRGTAPIKVTIPINPNFVLPPAISNSTYGPGLLKVHFKPQVDNFTRDLNNLIQSSIEGGIQSISGALGNALVSGNFGDVIGSFVSGIASFMEKLGASLIVTGVGIEAFKKSLESLQGGAAIVAGIGLIAGAAAFKAIATSGPSFAKGGGIVGAPQLAMIGDNPGREEYVIPSEVLDRLGGGGARVIRVVGVLRGQDIAFANQRATRAKSRIN